MPYPEQLDWEPKDAKDFLTGELLLLRWPLLGSFHHGKEYLRRSGRQWCHNTGTKKPPEEQAYQPASRRLPIPCGSPRGVFLKS